MNERLKELAVQAGLEFTDNQVARVDLIDLYRFAELVRQDERKGCAEHYLEIMRDAVESARSEEREACAVLCEKFIPSFDDGVFFAKVIRARGEPSPAFKNYMDDNWSGIV